ncbi:MAG: molybdopterin-guanine dinucleotide biosynthesis protein B [Candidatus Bathyarchaeia archaeon]|jgi:molybdopterin-guanine dinucleotide biosynthesis protein B
MVYVVAVVGTHHSGKTTTIEHLISALTQQGYRVGTIKHIHHERFSIDQEGTNTWRHTQAGSKVTVAIAPNEIAIIKKTSAELESLDQIIKQLENDDLDFIIIEGFHRLISKRADIPKIIAAKDMQNLQEMLALPTPPILAVTGLVAQNKPCGVNVGVPLISLPDEVNKLVEVIKEFYKVSGR